MIEENKNTLLVVDDENVNLKVLNHILGNEYTLYTAKSGIDAIQKTKEYKPDLILLDIVMPEMDGYQTLSAIRADEEIKNIPVIFISGLDSDEDEEKGLSLDAADYITKPFSAAIVKLRVRHQIRIINQLRTIERLSLIDQLTSLPNRRCFDHSLQIEWRQAIREQTPISLLMLDIDNFKNVNDTYGHQQGDIVLQMVSKTLLRSFRRPADFAARWGGEEFIVLLPNTRPEGAMEIAEKIRSDIEKTEVLFKEEVIKITISIGVNSLIPVKNSSLNAFISNADKALYCAKEAGKNRVFCN